MPAAPALAKSITLERHLPAAVTEQWSAAKLAETAKVTETTARTFLRRKLRQTIAHSEQQLCTLSADAGAIFHGAAMRQLRRLQRLARLDDDDWTAADYALEKHTMAMIRPLLEWCRMSPDDTGRPPTTAASGPPQLADGL
jgi:hypothetical protein